MDCATYPEQIARPALRSQIGRRFLVFQITPALKGAARLQGGFYHFLPQNEVAAPDAILAGAGAASTDSEVKQ